MLKIRYNKLSSSLKQAVFILTAGMLNLPTVPDTAGACVWTRSVYQSLATIRCKYFVVSVCALSCFPYRANPLRVRVSPCQPSESRACGRDALPLRGRPDQHQSPEEGQTGGISPLAIFGLAAPQGVDIVTRSYGDNPFRRTFPIPIHHLRPLVSAFASHGTLIYMSLKAPPCVRSSCSALLTPADCRTSARSRP